MAEIRLSKLTRQFNIGLSTLVDFLTGKGVTVNMDPNAKISDEYLPMIETKFGEEQKLKQDSEKVAIKLKEIIERGSKKKSTDTEEEDEPVQEIIIKSTSIAPETSAPKPETPAIQQPASETDDNKGPVQEEAAEPEKEQAARSGPGFPQFKVVDKIDLSKFEKHPKKEEKDEAEKPQTAAEEKPAAEDKPAEKPSEAAPAIEEPATEAPVQTAEDKPEEEKPAQPAEPKEVKIEVEKLAGPKVVGKIELSQFETRRSGKKRERIAKGGSQKVDVSKVQADNSGGRKDKKKDGGKKDSREDRKNRRNKGNDRFRPSMTEAETEEMQKEIQKQIKETYARMNEGKGKNNFGAKHRKEKRELASQKLQEEMEMQELEKKVLKVTEFVTVNDLATLMNTPVTKVIGACMSRDLRS